MIKIYRSALWKSCVCINELKEHREQHRDVRQRKHFAHQFLSVGRVEKSQGNSANIHILCLYKFRQAKISWPCPKSFLRVSSEASHRTLAPVLSYRSQFILTNDDDATFSVSSSKSFAEAAPAPATTVKAISFLVCALWLAIIHFTLFSGTVEHNCAPYSCASRFVARFNKRVKVHCSSELFLVSVSLTQWLSAVIVLYSPSGRWQWGGHNRHCCWWNFRSALIARLSVNLSSW